MTFDDLTPLITEDDLETHLDDYTAGATLPIAQVLRDEIPAWSETHAAILHGMATAANAGRIYKTMMGYPEQVGFETSGQCEAQIVEFVRFTGAERYDFPRDELEAVAVDLIRATPISDLDPKMWRDDDAAARRVADLYDFVQPDESDADDAAAESSPQDLSNVTTPSKNRATSRERDIRKDLFGK